MLAKRDDGDILDDCLGYDANMQWRVGGAARRGATRHVVIDLKVVLNTCHCQKLLRGRSVIESQLGELDKLLRRFCLI